MYSANACITSICSQFYVYTLAKLYATMDEQNNIKAQGIKLKKFE